MSSLSTFGTFTMARMGVYVAQQMLNVTGNNISNINTKGYSRQEIHLNNIAATGADRYQSKYDVRITGGAVADSVTQTRDKYLDIRYRDEMSSVGAMDAKLDGLQQLSTIIDEVGRGEDGEGVIEAAFENLIQQIETFSAEGAGKDAFDSIFRDASSMLVEKIRARAYQLNTIYTNITHGFEQDVQEVNSILTRIRDLNASIRRSQVYGGQPLDEMDQRNNLIDDLAEYMHIEVNYEQEDLGEGYLVDKLVIKTAGLPTRTLVDGIYATEMSIKQVQDTYKEDIYTADGKQLLHAKGDLMYYSDGTTPVMVNDPNFDLLLGPLTDVNGFSLDRQSSREDMGAVTFTVTREMPSPSDITVGKPMDVTQYPTSEEAAKVANYMNSLESFTNNDNGEPFVYSVYPDGTAASYHIHRTPSAVNDSRGYDCISSPGPIKSIDANLASDEDSTDTTDELLPEDTIRTVHTAFGTKEDAEAFARYAAALLPAESVEEDRSYIRYIYEVQGNDEDGYTVHQIKDTTGAIQLTDTELYGALQSTREILTEKGYYATTEDLERDVNASTKRGIPYYMKSLDTFANAFATMLNKANMLNDIAGFDGEGKPQYNTGDKAIYEYEKDEDGNYILDAEGYRKPVIDAHGYYQMTDKAKELNYKSGGVLFSNDGTGNDTTDISAANISISASWANGSFRVLSSTKPDAASTENDNLNRILVNILKGDHTFDPRMDGLNKGSDVPDSREIFFTGSFQELLSSHIAGFLGNDYSVTETMLDNYSVTVDELYVQRDSVMGVDLNDEAVNMMMYQKSYTAACRLMTMYDEMLDKLINGT